MKPLYRGLAVAVAAVGIAACVKQAWRVTYEGPDDYSVGTAVLVDDGGNAYMSGYLDNQSIFLAAYNASGKKVWDRVVEGDPDSIPNVRGRALDRDEEGNLYLIRFGRDMINELYKFDAEGNLLISKSLKEDDVDYMQIKGDVLYLGSRNGPVLHAYSLDGELLWAYPVDTSASMPTPDLGEYAPGVVAVAMDSSNGWPGPGDSRILDLDGRILLINDRAVVEFDSDGVPSRVITPAELGFEDVFGAGAFEGKLVVVGGDRQATETVTLNEQFTELSRTLVTDNAANRALVVASDIALCVASPEFSDSGQDAVSVFQLGENGQVRWRRQTVPESPYWEYLNIKAVGDECYLSILERDHENHYKAITQRFDAAGTLIDTIELSDFGIYGVAVQGKGIYHVGITGEYDGSVTMATLDKQPLK